MLTWWRRLVLRIRELRAMVEWVNQENERMRRPPR